MNEPKIAATSPVEVDLEEGKKYAFCTCGKSEGQPFCDGSHADTEFKPHVFEAEKSGKFWLCACKRTAKTPFCDGTHKSLKEE